MAEKRKNNPPCRAASGGCWSSAFALGVAVTLITVPPRVETQYVYITSAPLDPLLQAATGIVLTVTAQSGTVDPLLATATAIMAQATQQADGTQSFSEPIDPIFMTATAFVQQTTMQADSGTTSAPGQLDPIFLTATAIVNDATQQAAQPDKSG